MTPFYNNLNQNQNVNYPTQQLRTEQLTVPPNTTSTSFPSYYRVINCFNNQQPQQQSNPNYWQNKSVTVNNQQYPPNYFARQSAASYITANNQNYQPATFTQEASTNNIASSSTSNSSSENQNEFEGLPLRDIFTPAPTSLVSSHSEEIEGLPLGDLFTPSPSPIDLSASTSTHSPTNLIPSNANELIFVDLSNDNEIRTNNNVKNKNHQKSRAQEGITKPQKTKKFNWTEERLTILMREYTNSYEDVEKLAVKLGTSVRSLRFQFRKQRDKTNYRKKFNVP